MNQDAPIITYRTPAQATRPDAWLCPSLYVHFRVAMTIIEASGRARRGKYDDEAWRKHSARIRELLEHSGVQVEVENADVMGTLDSPFIVAGNHMSTFETFALPSIIAPYCPVTFVVKRSLVEYPVFKHVLLSRNPIVVDRENPREDLAVTLRGAVDRAKDGQSIIVFPQTTRAAEFIPSEFNTIGVKMARRAGVPVVPLALKTDAWTNGRWIKELGRIDTGKKVRFSFGQPLTVSGNGRAEHEQIIEFIEGKLKAWTEEEARQQKP